MKDKNKTKAQLIKEVAELHQRNQALEAERVNWKKSEEVLRESHKVQASLDNILQGVVLLDRQGQILAINDAGRRNTQLVFGRIAREGDSIYNFVHELDQPRLEHNFTTALIGTPVRAEVQVPTASNASYWFYINYTPVFDQEGQVWAVALTAINVTERKQAEEMLLSDADANREEKARLMAIEGVTRPIAERKRAEEALQQSEQRLELVLQGADLGLWDMNVQTNEYVVNQRAMEMSGYTLEEVGPLFHWWDELIHPNDLALAWADWEAHMTGQTPFYESEYRLQTKSGEWIWILDRGKVVEWDKAGKPLRATGTYLDITKRKQTEQALQQLNRELILLNNASRAFNSSLDLDVVLVSLLEEVRPLLGVIGASVWLIDVETGELVCHQASGAHRSILRGWRLPVEQGIVGWVARNGQSQIVPEAQADPRHFNEIEQELHLKLHSILAVPLHSKEKVIGVLEVVDTEANRFTQTELLLVESLAATAAIAIENARLYEQTRRDAETRAVLLREVNHRTKNNLAAIIGLLHLEQRHMSDEARGIYHTIMQDLMSRIHGLATVHRLLSMADWSPILLSELITKVIHSALQALPLDKSVSVEVSPSSILVAPKLVNSLALLINELTTNTIKYAWPTCESGRIMVQIDNEDDEVLIEFRDDGQGYPKEVLGLERYNVGWDLIQTLVQQGLQGQVTLSNDQGAVTMIRFPQLT